MTSIGIYLVAAFAFSIITSTNGQVYHNPNDPAPPAPEIKPTVAQQDGFITQTVYGFLDFTTTIGNTVMIFSPQSAPPQPPPEPPKNVVKTVTSVIETKPEVQDVKPKEIKPTKTATKSSKPKVSTKVEVIAGPPIQQSSKVQIIASKVEVVANTPNAIQQNPIEVKPAPKPSKVASPPPPVFSSIVEVRADVDPEPVLVVGNNLAEPEYDFLSRQPAPFAEESFRVVNIKPGAGKNGHRNRPSHEQRKLQTAPPRDTHPTGLVTTITGSVVRDGVTTVHETSVIGTYISGKYAQVLQSTSHVYKNHKPKVSPSSTLRILKTAAPTVPASRHHIDPSPTASDLAPLPEAHNGNSGPNLVRSSRRPATSSNSFKNRIRNRTNKDEPSFEPRDPPSTTSNSVSQSTTKKTSRHRSKSKNRRNKGTRKSTHTTTPAPAAPQPTEARRAFKPKLQAPNIEQDDSYKFKLNRSPGRWQYKTSPKPRVTIRKANGGDEAPVTPPPANAEVITNDIPTANARSDSGDLEPSGSAHGNVLNDAETGDNSIDNKKPLVETINVEISTPADFKDVYYEIATIKTPYTFQVGTIKNTRFITVTSTFEKSLEPEPTFVPTNPNEPLTENILAPTTHIDKEHNLLDSSIATLPPLYLTSDAETPPLETLTETFSTTQDMLKTHILPVIRDGGNATSYTLIQTYHITRLVTATKTLPPMDAYQFVPSKRLKEFNSRLDEAGSELHLELEFGDNNDEDDGDDEDHPVRQLSPELDLANIGSDFDLFDVDRAKLAAQQKTRRKLNKAPVEQANKNLSPDQLQQLALLRLLNPAAAAQVPQVLTTSKPVVKLETVYESHVIPVFNGQSTTYSTISRPVGTVSRTEFEIETSTLPAVPLPQLPVNPLFPPQQPFGQPQFQVTTAPIVTQTVITQTQSKILKLTFGAKTAYTTLFSTNVVPTMLTTYVTTSVAVQPTAAFPGFFPAPFAPYPYVG
ncbi:unnamed protein product [Hermetia illucens]|uniref:DUF4758 domain-containing protein n=1 Tax=Hermetia illucens TaxID=343691 RepID=A0A7R8UWE2_HERIL|nr:cell wall protein DAN4 isoform X2 [Hermetia illucens]CAD7088345.1 unnamed protein product [Hermetia illucens]